MATAEKILGVRSRTHSHSVSRWVALVFGCGHRQVSRPFTRQGQTYRACLECGARRMFDLQNWEDRGGFQYADV